MSTRTQQENGNTTEHATRAVYLAREEVRKAQEQVERAELKKKAALDRAQKILENLAAKTAPSQLEEVLTFLYWMPELKVPWIEKAFKMKNHTLRQHVRPVDTGCRCITCARSLVADSRTKLAEIKAHFESAERTGFTLMPWCYMCAECARQESAVMAAAFEAQSKARQQRLRELCAMSYSEYLRSPEWMARRIEHVREVKFRCQFCSETDEDLHVHRRPTARRASESYEDIVALCGRCYSGFSERGDELIDEANRLPTELRRVRFFSAQCVYDKVYHGYIGGFRVVKLQESVSGKDVTHLANLGRLYSDFEELKFDIAQTGGIEPTEIHVDELRDIEFE